MVWMESRTSACSNKVKTWYRGVCTTCKGVDWLPAKLSSSFQSVSFLPSFLCRGRDPRDFLYLWLWCLWDSNGRCKNPCIHPCPYEPALPESCPSIGSLICPLTTQVLFSFPLGPTPSLISLKVFVWVKALWVYETEVYFKLRRRNFWKSWNWVRSQK